MKVILTPFVILKIAIAFFLGAYVGGNEFLQFNPFISGIVTVAGFMLAKRPQGVASDGLDISEVTTQLGEYIQLNLQNIFWQVRQGLELEQYMTRIGGVTGKWAATSASMSEMHQPFQKAFTPKGKFTMTPYINEAFRLKIDYLLDDLDDLYNGWLDEWATDETKERKDWPFVRYVVEMGIIPKMIEERNIMAYSGIQAAPTPGTAGSAISSINGIGTIIANELTAGNIVPIATGAITTSNAVDKFEVFMDAIPEGEKSRGGIIMCSKGNERKYMRNYRSIFGGTNAAGTKGNTQMDDYNVRIVGLEAWGNSNRLFFQEDPKKNLVALYNKLILPTKFEVQAIYRDVVLMADYHYGVGFRTLQNVRVNDQA